jgi:outer membrane protein OmpA-like peptidoglycan-associated protein
MRKLLLIGALATTVAACTTAPQRSEQVERARTEIQNLAQDPLAEQAAGRDLESARKSLEQAEMALQQRQPPATVDHLAYLALRHAQAGEARVAEAHGHQEVAQAQADRDKILKDARTREARAAQADAASARNQAAAAQAQLSSAEQQLADLQAKKTDRGVIVTLGDVLFDTGQATLKPGANVQINRLATYLRDNPKTRVLVEGHTDSRGSDEYNEALSERRAGAVAETLQSNGISPDQVQTVGRGKAYPVASNDTAAGRQQNRRVEVVFSDASGHFAQGVSPSSRR